MTHSRLIWPRARLAGLIALAVERDTRAAILAPEDRFNCFPATPLCTATFVRAGRLRLTDERGEVLADPLPPLFVSGPLRKPLVSFAEGPLHAMTVALYPDSWFALTGVSPEALADRHVALASVLGGGLLAAFEAAGADDDFRAGFGSLQERLEPHWKESRPQAGGAPEFVGDWIRAASARAAVAGGGVRQMQRLMKRRTGQSLRELGAFARFDGLLARLRGRAGALSELAADAGYADQSHMGREVRRMTGLSPARLKRLVATDERYWAFRLFAKRNGRAGASPPE